MPCYYWFKLLSSAVQHAPLEFLLENLQDHHACKQLQRNEADNYIFLDKEIKLLKIKIIQSHLR